MAVQLPTPKLQTIEAEIVQASRDQRTPSGGNLQRVNFKGDHYRFYFVTEPLLFDVARGWGGLRTRNDTVRIEIVQVGIDIGAPGNPVADGGPQAGANLAVRNLTPFYPVQEGQALNHIDAAGERRLYICRDTVVADAAGDAIIPLETMLTWPVQDGDNIALGVVMIEGHATVDQSSWKKDGNGYQTLSFSIEEQG